MAANVMEIYGSKVFNEHVMKERLPSATYKSLKNTLHKGAPLDIEVANVVASVMKRWAMELGATHYTHWFQPLTGITSEKHDGFVSPEMVTSLPISTMPRCGKLDEDLLLLHIQYLLCRNCTHK